MCRDRARSSFLCVLSLASVINQRITCHYPDFGAEKYKQLFNSYNYPRSFYTSSENVEIKGGFYILFCNLNVSAINDFVPNHFVPLIKYKSSKRVNKKPIKRKVPSSIDFPINAKRNKSSLNVPIAANIFNFFKPDRSDKCKTSSVVTSSSSIITSTVSSITTSSYLPV